ncbi:hypothetical protein EWM64_g2782 [Hericium alpestre]|uniref:Carboxypeptidase n=1 Tax=Hericium alpestre TaxID=135208 RepID=A0A4Z0A4Q5_9AGAM|nr:hypothetical protein EWM64_g2782 [Hericium alpestre]
MKGSIIGAVPSLFLILFSSARFADAAFSAAANSSSSALPSAAASSASASSSANSTVSNSISASNSSASATSTSIPLPHASPTIPGQPSNSFPQNYSGIPEEGDFSPGWQDCKHLHLGLCHLYYGTHREADFEVQQGLPNITFPLPRNFAGNLPVGRSGHPNNTLFFWGFETTSGSLTVPAADAQLQPWLIWLGGGGGPGSSSLFTAMTGNGFMSIHPDFSITQNDQSWTNMIDLFWIDQPVGSGFSTADLHGYISNEGDMASDFLGFLSNLVKVFPSLAKRPLTLAGEDYAGIFIPYIAQALLASSSPPVSLKKIAIGNGLMGGFAAFPHVSTLSVLESFPQLIKFDQNVFTSFQSKEQLCGYDLNITYPQEAVLPSVQSSPRRSSYWMLAQSESKIVGALDRRELRAREISVRHSRRQSSLSGSLDPFYGCSLFDEMIDYAVNNSFPWTPGTFNIFDVSDVVNPLPSLNIEDYFNSDQVRGALHAPTSKNWSSVSAYPFGSSANISSSDNPYGDPSPEPATFFNELVSTAMSQGVQFILFAGSNNAIANHHSLEILIQNATFGGTRGFTRKPATPFADDDGKALGIVHQERGITYALFDNIGHLIPQFNPSAAYVFFRDFILNSNTTGSITSDSKGHTVVLGGENPSIANDVPRIATALFLGATSTQSTLFAPSATVAAWESFLGTVPNLEAEMMTNAAAPWPGGLVTLSLAALLAVWGTFALA